MVDVTHLSLAYPSQEQPISILNDVSFSIAKGETVAILGPSGSGKTTLLSLLGGLSRPQQGQIEIDSTDITKFNEQELTSFRSKNIGIVFQHFHLIPYLTASENIQLPLDLNGTTSSHHLCNELMEQVGISHRASHLPSQLSGGEKQRVAIARALITEPKLLLADEPSGSLDEKTGSVVMDLFFDLVLRNQSTMVLVTHNHVLAKKCQRQLYIENGQIHE